MNQSQTVRSKFINHMVTKIEIIGVTQTMGGSYRSGPPLSGTEMDALNCIGIEVDKM